MLLPWRRKHILKQRSSELIAFDRSAVENPTAVALASVVVDAGEQDKCHFPISIAFSTALVKHPRSSIEHFHAVFHVAREVYLGHPLYENFIQQLESERDTNDEYKLYHNAVAYYSLKDVQEVFKDVANNVMLGGHYYFKYVLPTLDRHGFLDLLSDEEAVKVYDHPFDTVSLYLLERFGCRDSHSKEEEEAKSGPDSISCKELFKYFSKMNEERGAVFHGTSLYDLYFDLFGEPLSFFGDRSTCIERSRAAVKIFLALLGRLGVFHD